MKCDSIKEQLSGFLDGELGEAEAARVRAHLDECGACRAEFDALRRMSMLYHELEDPEPVPRGTDYSSVLESDQPIVVQHSRLDSRQAENALITTMAYPAD